ncbi:hypothetical protein CDD83_3461 [Cordyceps sp. RAO-2017]|nr:hypothetical protein CDD83_3461 [Cordyceps sp. RAO-2017]
MFVFGQAGRPRIGKANEKHDKREQSNQTGLVSSSTYFRRRDWRGAAITNPSPTPPMPPQPAAPNEAALLLLLLLLLLPRASRRDMSKASGPSSTMMACCSPSLLAAGQ